MKLSIIYFLGTLFLTTSFAGEQNSILFPKQLQPKLTFKERCEIGQEWKRYGSMRECTAEKRHEELVAIQKENAERAEELANVAAERLKKIQEDARLQYEMQLLNESIKNLNTR